MNNPKEKRNKRSHYKKGIDGNLIPKVSYETEKEALTVARFLNTKQNIIHKMIIYKCIECGKWHIGSSRKEITEKDRKHAKEQLVNCSHDVHAKYN